MAAANKSSDGLGRSFGFAAWVVLAGVLTSWVVLKQSGAQADSHLPDIPTFALTTVQDVDEVNWLAQAEQAFAAGRIAKPENNSALHFYQQQLNEKPGDDVAIQGIERVVNYLMNAAEDALRQEQWMDAAELADEVLEIDKGNLAARSIVARVDRSERIAELSDRAVAQIAAGKLTRPEGDNALESYQAILQIDPTNPLAKQGVESVAQRLATIAQTEAFAENHDRARVLIARAKEIAPDAPGIAETEKLTIQWSDLVKDKAIKDDLLAAARAVQDGNLAGEEHPSGLGALHHYQSALKKDPDSPAAKSGIALVLRGLLERADGFVEAQDLPALTATMELAEDAGADANQLAALANEQSYLQRLEKARNGDFDEILPIRNLEVRRQVSPVLGRSVDAGWIELLFTVTESGDVTDVLVVDSSSKELNDPAIDAVQRWRFAPFLDEGRPLPVRSGVRFTFQS